MRYCVLRCTSTMSALRAVVLVWFLAMAVMGQMEPNCLAGKCIEINATVGQYVVLPCPCSRQTKVVVWQINDSIVNHYGTNKVEETKLSQSYKNRTDLSINLVENSCALGLNVLLSDQKTFTCYVQAYNEEKKVKYLENPFHVKLNVFEEANSTVLPLQHDPFTNGRETNGPNSKPQTELSVGVPLSLLLLILVVLIMVLVIRKHRHKTPQMVIINDQQATTPMMMVAV